MKPWSWAIVATSNGIALYRGQIVTVILFRWCVCVCVFTCLAIAKSFRFLCGVCVFLLLLCFPFVLFYILFSVCIWLLCDTTIYCHSTARSIKRYATAGPTKYLMCHWALSNRSEVTVNLISLSLFLWWRDRTQEQVSLASERERESNSADLSR